MLVIDQPGQERLYMRFRRMKAEEQETTAQGRTNKEVNVVRYVMNDSVVQYLLRT